MKKPLVILAASLFFLFLFVSSTSHLVPFSLSAQALQCDGFLTVVLADSPFKGSADIDIKGDDYDGRTQELGTKCGLIIHGNNRPNKLYGGAGADQIYGYDGIDTIYGSGGDDFVSGGGDWDTLYGGWDNSDGIGRQDGNDTIEGGDGVDFVRGGNNNFIYGGSGVVWAGSRGDDGSDTIDGGDGDDVIEGGNDNAGGGQGHDADDKIFGGAGNDVIYGGNNNNIEGSGNDGNDTIDGGDGDDELYGGNYNHGGSGDDGNDDISAGAGANTLYGGNFNDFGGSGKDNQAGGGDTLKADNGTLDVFIAGGNSDAPDFGADQILYDEIDTLNAMCGVDDTCTAYPAVSPPACQLPTPGWVSFDHVSAPGAVPKSTMKEETTSGLMVNFDIPGMYIDEIEVLGAVYHHLSIPGQGYLMDVGKPDVPIVGQIVEIPFGVDLVAEVEKSTSVTFDCFNVYPAQEPEITQDEEKPREFAYDTTTYRTDSFFPGDLSVISAEDVGVVRGHRLVFLKVNPVQFNPVSRQLEGYSNIEIRLRYAVDGEFQPAQIEPVDSRIMSSAFEEMLGASVLNYKQQSLTAQTTASGSQEPPGYEYLIITDGSFYNPNDSTNPVVRLRDWKQRKGYRTKVVDVATIITTGDPAADIRDYIQIAYDTWHPAPVYVLLIGDAELIPTNYQNNNGKDTVLNPDYHNGTRIGTDLYYATVDNSDPNNPDPFPDIFLGRLPVDTLAQAEDLINKIIEYEQDPPTTSNFYGNVSLNILFEDDTDAPTMSSSGTPVPDTCPADHQEDCGWGYIAYSEEVWTFLDSEGYSPQRIYATSSGFPGTATAPDPLSLENGVTLANEYPHLLVSSGFQWNGGHADIVNAINAGAFLVVYNGHGGRGGWGLPGFGVGDINSLTNGNLSPVVFSFACQTGWFDNETDDDLDPSTPAIDGPGPNDESMAELILRRSTLNPDGTRTPQGAVAFIGASRNAWTTNRYLFAGVFKAIWPTFNPTPPSSMPPKELLSSGPLYKLGQILNFSKNYLALNIPGRTEFELYHLFGDPEMPIWTAEPATLNVDHPVGIGSTPTQHFVVQVTDANTKSPVRNATVVLTRADEIVDVQQTDAGGVAYFMLENPGDSDLDITVTAHNFRPYQNVIDIKAGGGVLNRLYPDNGTSNQEVLVGGRDFLGNEPVEIFFGGQKQTQATASGGSFGQLGSADVTFRVPSSYPLGPTNVVAHGLRSGRYAADVFQVRSSNPIDLYTYSQWDSSTWHLAPGGGKTWNSPDIQLYDDSGDSVESNDLAVGHRYTIRVKVHNDTDFNAENVAVTFKWANYNIGGPFEEIDTVYLDVPAHSVQEAEIDWAPPTTGHLCIQAVIYHIEDINAGPESNNVGQENTHVGPTSSPAEVEFQVWNPTDQPAMVFLELRQVLHEDPENPDYLWETSIRQPSPQLIPPGEYRMAAAIVDPGPNGRPGQRAEFELTGYINGEMIGGVNFTITVEEAKRTTRECEDFLKVVLELEFRQSEISLDKNPG
jgi:hypothetical protein